MKSPLWAVSAILIFLWLTPGCRSAAPGETAQAQARLGTQATKAGLYREAYFRFERASSLDPSNARYLNNLAILAEALGKLDLAEAHYAKAVALAPGDKRIRENHDKLKAYLDPGQPPAPAR
jgi:Flp pilus assembly protein TadD